ncbi:MAG: right-handed parallel beta-helix repeat-containing protein [Candidatus Cyclobacteriaceae bacterium M3_2C_046]
MKHCCLILSFFLLLAHWGSGQHKEVFEIYLSPDGQDQHSGLKPEEPIKSIDKGLELLRRQKRKNNQQAVTVYFMKGLHQPEQPIILTPEHSGSSQFPVRFTSYGSEKARISGGRKITGWKKHRNNIWKAPVPAVEKGAWSFRQLYINGKLKTRARMPNQGFYRVAGFPDGGREVHYHTDCQRFEFAPGDIKDSWKNLQDVEVIVYHFWTDSHLPIQAIDRKNHIVTFKHKAGKVFTDDFTSNGARYIVENVFEGLDQPGEWYLDKSEGMIYYIPEPGQDMDQVDAVAPFLPQFIRMEGVPAQRAYVSHVRFDNINFEFTNFELPPGNSNDQQGSASVPAGISLTGAQNCSFTDLTIQNTGTFAFELADGCAYNTISNNTLSYLGAGGFRINGGNKQEHPLLRTHSNEISHNLIHHYGEEFPSAVGILLMNTYKNKIIHNHLHHGWYTGISVGWEWGYQRSISRDNLIAYNHIHDIGQGLLSDMGAIYTLGVSPGTIIRHNMIHDIDANHYGGWGIYNDEGSTHILIEKNIVYNTKFAPYNIHYAKEITVRNNIFALGRLQQLSRSRIEPHKSLYFENNIVYWKEGELLSGKWEDQPYQFYFNPKNQAGTRQVSSTFDINWNLYYNPNKQLDQVEFNGKGWAEWQKAGKDTASLYTDPLFMDLENYNFTLRKDSPAFKLGFEPIDLNLVGPQTPDSSPISNF